MSNPGKLNRDEDTNPENKPGRWASLSEGMSAWGWVATTIGTALLTLLGMLVANQVAPDLAWSTDIEKYARETYGSRGGSSWGVVLLLIVPAFVVSWLLAKYLDSRLPTRR